MQKSCKIVFFLIVVLICKVNLQAQNKTIYKDVLLNGKEAKLNLATGDFIFKDSKGNDSIVNRNKPIVSNENAQVVQPNKIEDSLDLEINETTKARNLISIDENVENVKQKLSKEADVWVVEKGNTLYSISRKTGISITDLKRINNLEDNNLAIGQKLSLK